MEFPHDPARPVDGGRSHAAVRRFAARHAAGARSRRVYAAARPGNLSDAVRQFPERVYVPNSGRDTVDVIDPRTFKIVDHFPVGRQPQHVIPSVRPEDPVGVERPRRHVTRIDPATGQKGDTVAVKDPYNMYFTPDGRYAIVVAERMRRLDFRDPLTMKLVESVPVPCRGVDHMDFSANGRYLIASCEFSGELVKVDVATRKLVGTLKLPGEHRMPQDVRLSPDGSIFWVADMASDGVFQIDGEALKVLDFLPTGKGAHGLYFSRDSKWLYVSNRGEGSVGVIDVRTRTLSATWKIPRRRQPRHGRGVGRRQDPLAGGPLPRRGYAFDTGTGTLVARIPVGKGPHGLCIYPQPGRYSLGHTGNMR